jgi:transposase
LAVATVFEVRDEIWEVVEPMIPPVKVPERQGRRPVADRVCFEAIVFVMITGIAWGHLPSELGCSGVTAWRRLRDWQLAGVWERLHAALLQKLNAAGRSTAPRRLSTAAIFVLFKGALTGPSPVDRGRTGSKHHLIVDPSGIPPYELFSRPGTPKGCSPRCAPAVRA